MKTTRARIDGKYIACMVRGSRLWPQNRGNMSTNVPDKIKPFGTLFGTLRDFPVWAPFGTIRDITRLFFGTLLDPPFETSKIFLQAFRPRPPLES